MSETQTETLPVEPENPPETDEPDEAVDEDPEDDSDAPCPVCGLRRQNRCSHV